MSLRGRTLIAAVVAAGACSAPAAAAPIPNPTGQARLDLTVRFLQNAQNADGGWGGAPGSASDPGFTAWVALALAAGGVNPMDQAAQDGVDAYTYLTRHAAELKYTTDFERVLLVAVAAGAPARNFGGVDLVGRILSRRLPDGSFAHEAGGSGGGINDTAFAVLPFSALGDPSLAPVIADAARWLKSVQSPAGGWSYNPNVKFGVSSDMTASVLEALRAAGQSNTPEEQLGWLYLRHNFKADSGGFTMVPDETEANTASTAWAVQGMWAIGLEPATALGSPSPLDYMAAMQADDGMIRWKASTQGTRDNPIWMTAYCAPAFAGYPLPIPQVARAVKPAETPPPATTPDQGVTSGGGGNGAPLYSRPEPQSQGQTAGGVRATTPTAEQAAPHASTKRRRPSTQRDATTPPRTTSASNGNGGAGVTRDRARTTATPAPTPSATPTSQATAGLAGASGGSAGDGRGGPGGGGTVQGDIVGLARSGADGDSDTEGAAPGLRAAPEHDRSALAIGLGALVLLGVGIGMNLERTRVVEAA